MRKSFVLLAALAIPAAANSAEPQRFANHYSVSLLGLPIAKSSFSGTFDGRNFVIDGRLKSSGLARIFDDTKGQTKVYGYLAGSSVVPISYALSYRSGRKTKSTMIGFERGRVVKTVNAPEPKKRRGWIPVANSHLDSVADPLTSTLVKADGFRNVCNRTIRIFDGEMRSDLRLSGGAIRPFTTSGYRGEAVVCNARFVAVSGYRKGSSGTEYLQKRSKIRIAFAPLGNTGVFAPVSASIGTKVGTLRIHATRFGASK